MNSREKIHELVNMARHPEAKDLAEALEMESKYDDCLYECQMVEYGEDNIHYTKMTKLEYFKKSLEMNNVYLDVDNLNFSILARQKPKLYNLKIVRFLGRPITAFDVCWALNKKQPEHYYFATDNGIWASYELKDKCEGIIVLVVEFKTKKSDGTDIFSTEWNDDTSDEIVKLINLSIYA